jgi:hypothetical protein
MQPSLAVRLLCSSPAKAFQLFLFFSPSVTQNCPSHKITLHPGLTTHYRFVSADHDPGPIILSAQPRENWTIYPVPVKDVLNLRYDGKEPLRGVINVIIRHINGRVFHRLRFASLNRNIPIPVNNLGSGTYDITIVINDKVEWYQRFVK